MNRNPIDPSTRIYRFLAKTEGKVGVNQGIDAAFGFGPDAALGSLPSVALSSGQPKPIVLAA